MRLKENAEKLKTDIPALYLCMKDPRTPKTAKIMAAVTVGYALSPVDLIPDFIPILGVLDDMLLLPLMITLVIRLIPVRVMEENRIKANGMWENGRPRRWYYAIPVVIFWLLIVLIVVKAVFF